MGLERGTLWDDLPQVHEAANDALREVGGPLLTLSEYNLLFVRPVSIFYQRVLGRELAQSELRRANERFAASYQEGIHVAQLAVDAIGALDTVVQSGGTQSILSLYPHQSLVMLVGDLGIGDYFTRIDGLRGAPGASKVGMFAEHLLRAAPGVPPHRAVMIGDTADDLAAARASGSNGILVNHHGYPPASAGEPFSYGLLDALRQAGIPWSSTS